MRIRPSTFRLPGELEIGDRIDEEIAQDFEEYNVSVGRGVKALVLIDSDLFCSGLSDPSVFWGDADRLAHRGRGSVKVKFVV